LLKSLGILFGTLVFLALVGAGGLFFVFYHYGRGLPDYRQLADYEPAVTTRVHAGDGRLMAEYAVQKRTFVPIRAMPKRVINAFLSAEDSYFYSHPGINLLSVARAAITNLRYMGTGRRPVGASTITQQVAKNFLLTNEVSIERKVKEAILALRIERTLTKDRILELYLNEIYLGYGSYGVAAAALNYFNKSLDELSISEAAFLAALPKAPNNYNPVNHPEEARARRDWVVDRMEEDGVIPPSEASLARAANLVIRNRKDVELITADYFAEEVRREIADRFGESQLYRGGLSVKTTLNTQFQEIAARALRAGLEAYDRRHGWRGPIAKLDIKGGDWQGKLRAVATPVGLGKWSLAVVRKLNEDSVEIGFASGKEGHIPFAEMRWARAQAKDQTLGPGLRRPADALAVGDVIAVDEVTQNSEGKAYPANSYALRQIPEIEGALVALDPHTGRVLAMVGGYDYERSQFNRVTQAQRQPGSSFKPFVYMSALDAGFTPSTLILDAPFVIDQGPGLPKWRPQNYSNHFYGPSTMRTGIEQSRNLMTARLAHAVGMEKVAQTAEAFGVVDHMPRTLSMSLGASETTLLRLTTAYAMLVNGGKKITPTLIDRIQDRSGQTIFRHDNRPCNGCSAMQWTGQTVPTVPDTRPAVADPATAYQMVSMLQGVVERGTGVRLRPIGRPLAGKTGTTNDSFDAWFIGFTPDLALGVFTGFDNPRTLGKTEQGASVAAPIFGQFIQEALKEKPATPFRIPPGIRMVRVVAQTGELARPGDRSVILEAFKPGAVPTGRGPVLDGMAAQIGIGGGPVDELARETGGLY
jgi:penicillin-binding protein 1A